MEKIFYYLYLKIINKLSSFYLNLHVSEQSSKIFIDSQKSFIIILFILE